MAMGTANSKSHIFANWKSVQIKSTNDLHFDYSDDTNFNWYIIYLKNRKGLGVYKELKSGEPDTSNKNADFLVFQAQSATFQ